MKIYLSIFIAFLFIFPVLGEDCNTYKDADTERVLLEGNYTDFEYSVDEEIRQNGGTRPASHDRFMKTSIIARRNDSIRKLKLYKRCVDNTIKTKTPTEQCQDSFGNNSYYQISTKLCYCKEGYTRSSDKTYCEIENIKTIDEDISNNIENNSGDELQQAISWMYDNGLTSYSTIDDFIIGDYLTREQASKFFVLFSTKILGKTIDTKKSVFLNDITKADKTLQLHIKGANQLGLFKGVNGNFLPFNKLTRAQTITVIIRSIVGNQNEKGTQWYSEYYNIANDYGILNGLGFDFYTLDSINITRGEVALLLHRLFVYNTNK